MEEWKNYPFDTRYQVSNYGNIKGQKGNILKGSINNAGYKRIGLYSDGKAVFKFVHRMVMETFSPCANSDDLIVNHKDGNKLNNNLDNLEWCTTKENAEHARDILKISYNTENAHEARKIKINVLNENKEIIQTFNSINECANFYNIKYQTIQYYLKTQTMWKNRKIFFEIA